MKALKPVAVSLSLAFAAGSAMATQLPSVQVVGENANALVISCSNPDLPSKQDVNRILHLNTVEQSNALRNKLMAAAAEACQAGEPRILVQRSAAGKMTWVAAQ